MKTLTQWIMALAIVAGLGGFSATADARSYGSRFGGGALDQHSVLTINADGSSLFISATVQSRTVMEQQVRMMERYQNKEDDADADETAPPQPPVTATNEAKAFTDDELAKKLTAQMEENGDDPDLKFNVAVNKDNVTATTTRSFSSVEDMLKESYSIWSDSGVQFENARFETDTNGLLRLTLSPRAGMERYLKQLRSAWKLSGAKSELKLVFPGRVVSSGFPVTQTNSTWLTVDAQQDGSFDAVAKLYAAPTIITAEAGGLALKQPVESKKLWRGGRGQGGNDDLPITDAGPGFLAEAQSLTTTTLHVFPDGTNYFAHKMAATGVVVSVKFFAPKGRTLKSVSNSRVVTAIDNKGRSLVPAKDENEANEETESGFSSYEDFRSSGSSDTSSMRIELKLQLPLPDAQSIDKVSAETVAVTAGKWKEMTLTNLKANATNEFDLSDVLPGAKIIIEKLRAKNSRLTIQASIKGPVAAQRLEVSASISGVDSFNRSSSDLRSRVKGGQVDRKIQITGYGMSDQSALSPQAVILKIRYPEDLQRERVKFDLKGLDLF